uniref:immunoglobulin domain-containing protein n=1 Tax=Ancylomarina sp. TaxID=1970196 RepID=UPI003568A2AC
IIYDDIPPELDGVVQACYGTNELKVDFTEILPCNSLDINEVSLTIGGFSYSVTDITSSNCDSGGEGSAAYIFILDRPISNVGSSNLSIEASGIADMCGNVNSVASNMSFIVYKASVSLSVNKSPACMGEDVIVTANANSGFGAYTYEFHLNGSPLVSDAQYSIVGSQLSSNTFTDGDVVKVIVTDENACSVTSTEINVSISSLPVKPTGLASQSYCAGETVADLVVSSGSNAIDWYAVSANGTALNNIDVLSTGTYYAESRDVSSGCVSSSRLEVTVAVNDLPTVPTGDASRSFCGSGTIADLVATSGSDAVDWYSEVTGGIVLNSTDALSSVAYYAEGINATTGCVSSSRLQVIVSVNPSVSVIAGSNQRVCQGELVELSPTVSPASGSFSYEWRIQGETDILASTKDYSFVAMGDPDFNSTVKYEVTATDVHTSCSSTDVVSITNLSTPAATTVTSSNPSCPNLDSGSITFSFPDHLNRTNIQFSINGSSGTYENSVDDAGSYIFSSLDAGDYDVYVRWGNHECPLDLGFVTLKLENISDMSFSYTEPAYCSNELDLTPIITTSGGIFTSTDGLSIDSTTGVIDLSASTSGTYVVTYAIDGDCGGSSIQEVTINTSPKPIGIFFD